MATASGGERSVVLDKVSVWAEDLDTYLTIEDDGLGTGAAIITLPRHDAMTRDIRAMLAKMGRKVD